jgi:tRNA-specific 2-thiouridylase
VAKIKNNKKLKACPEPCRRVVVAMSGGVDSSVCVALLKQAGFCAEPGRSIDVVGVMMKFWTEGADGKNRCCSVESEKLARLVAKKIGIPFYVINVEKEFKKKVVDYFLKEYKAGRTPNPCVVCNKEIKFGLLIEKALKMGADFVATGHYTTINNGKLSKGFDKEKDQSYFLWQLNQKQLSRVLFPVGGYTKPEVRKLAKKFELPTAETPESQEVCFVQNTTNDFLKKYLKTKPGKITDKAGKVVGGHQGLWFYTIGQRKGLEIAQGPWYVAEKDFKKNNLIVSKNKKDLLKKELIAGNVNWISPQKLPLNAEVKIRYKSELAKAKILKNKNNQLKVVFQKPQKAITPGQSVVFYKGNELLGGGVIE